MSEGHQQLLAEATTATDRAKSIRVLAKILADDGGKDFISRLDRKDGESCIEILDHGLSGNDLSRVEKQTFFVTLWKLTATHRRLPDSVTIMERPEVPEDMGAEHGSTDMRVGKYKGNLVAVATRTIPPTSNLDWIRQGFCKQVILWSKLSHPNVSRLLGILGDMEKGPFATVSEWMAGGHIIEYIKHNSANRLELLYGAAQGLKYLHDEGIVHGDVKGQNILVEDGAPPGACLADFACTTLYSGEPIPFDIQLGHGTVEFKSPERFNPDKFGVQYPLVAREADVYAFGMTIFQVLTGDTPFPGLGEAEVIDSVVNGLRPVKPQDALAIGFSDSLWDFVQLCWDDNRTRRPTAGEVVRHLKEAATNRQSPMPATMFTPAKNGSEPINHLGSPPSQPTNSNDSPSANDQPRGVSIIPSGESGAHLRSPSDGASDGATPPPAQLGLPQASGEGVSQDAPVSTPGPPRATPQNLEGDRNVPPSLLIRIGNGFRAIFAAVRAVVPRPPARNGGAPDPPIEDNHNNGAREDNPPSPILRGSRWPRRFSCF